MTRGGARERAYGIREPKVGEVWSEPGGGPAWRVTSVRDGGVRLSRSSSAVPLEHFMRTWDPVEVFLSVAEIGAALDEVLAEAHRNALEDAAQAVEDLITTDDPEAEHWTPKEALRAACRAVRSLAQERLSVDEALALMEAVDSGADPVVDTPGGTWDEVYAGNVLFITGAGHAITVFNDCGAWDYVDHVRHADGREWDFGGLSLSPSGEPDTRVENWKPKRRARWGMRWRPW